MSFLQVLRRQPFAYSRISIPSICSRRGYADDAAPAKDAKKAPAPAAARSSCQPDTILTGLNYLKGQAPVVALKDEEYPEWLWNTLQPRVYEDDGPGGKKERVERKKIRQQAIKDRNFMSTQ